MIFGVAQAHQLRQAGSLTLLPGTLLTTGTPPGGHGHEAAGVPEKRRRADPGCRRSGRKPGGCAVFALNRRGSVTRRAERCQASAVSQLGGCPVKLGAGLRLPSMKPLLMLGLFAALCVPVHAHLPLRPSAMAKAPATLSGESWRSRMSGLYLPAPRKPGTVKPGLPSARQSRWAQGHDREPVGDGDFEQGAEADFPHPLVFGSLAGTAGNNFASRARQHPKAAAADTTIRVSQSQWAQ